MCKEAIQNKFYLSQFLIYLKTEKQYSELTVKSYKNDLLKFFLFLEKNNISENQMNRINYRLIRMFLRELENQVSETTSEKYNRNTLIRILSGIKSYYKYLKLKSIISDNPTKLVSSPKKNKYIPEFMFETEIEDLFNLPKVNTPLGLRDYLILECLYSTGARVSELVSLTVTMISNKDLIKILGKGNKERLIPIGERLKRAVYDFLPMRKLYLGKYNKADSDYLFFNSKGDKLTDRGVRYIINKYLMKSSLMKNISPHTFRHTFATHLLNNGADIRAVQELLGHSSLSTTQVYTHLTTDKLRRVYQQFHPRS